MNIMPTNPENKTLCLCGFTGLAILHKIICQGFENLLGFLAWVGHGSRYELVFGQGYGIRQ